VGRSAELIELVVCFSASEGAGGGVDIQSFGSHGSGEDTESAGVSKEVQEAGGAKGFQVKAVFSLIREKARGDVWGEIDRIV
jgi:hypothetical protein